MRSQLLPDLLRRVLAAAGYDVTYVTNITDVGHLVSDADEGDDKMERAAAATGQTAAEIAARWTAQWEGDRRRRTEARRGGKEGVSTGRSRWSPAQSKKKTNKKNNAKRH